MFLKLRKLKSEKSEWIDFKEDSTLFLFVIYCLSLNYIHTAVLGRQTN